LQVVDSPSVDDLSVTATSAPFGLESASGMTYVAITGAHNTPFATWTDAATNIQDAVEVAPYILKTMAKAGRAGEG
jgi:hypothetical protein